MSGCFRNTQPETGRATEIQKVTVTKINGAGGVAAIVRSVNDVKAVLEKLGGGDDGNSGVCRISANIAQLRFELEHFNAVQPEEVIEAMTFAAPANEKVTTSHISDKTCQIALVYRESAERMNKTSKREIEIMISVNEYELRRLDYCIERLETKIRTVVKAVYIEQARWSEICSGLFITEKTVSKYKKKGIDELVRMFEIYT